MTTVWDYIWIVQLLPVAGFLAQALFGQRIIAMFGPAMGRRICGAMAVVPIALAFVIGVFVFYKLTELAPDQRVQISTWFNWIDLQTLRVPFELRVDPLSLTMVLIVTGVGALIHLYATGYMATDRDYPRFFTYLSLFIAFMLMLVLGNNLALVFIGWEGVGLCSYLLIGYWYHDIANAKAANKAFIVNRIGDWGFVLGIFLIYVTFASSQAIVGDEARLLSFDVILPLAEKVLPTFGPAVVTAVPILLFIGAMGKSAQFPLYLWLPDAMAGPTPVSALIHAATMVTAGVYLVTRCHVFFELSPIAMLVVACVGAFTAIFAATVAFGQTDIKKVLAYSTVSQLGYMFLACGVGAFYAGMFHVTTHAFFKALLFLGSGAVIVAMAHEQDMRRYGALRKYLPITHGTMLIGWIAIAGIPPLAGFFSKDDILGKTFASSHYWNEHGWLVDPKILYAIGLITAFMTAMYMTRMFWLTFLGKEERWRESAAGVSDEHAHHEAHVHHPHAHAEHEDTHGFFLADDEVLERERAEHEAEHHDALTPDHQPKEVVPSMWLPLVALAALSIVGGLVLSGGYPFSELLHWDTQHLFRDWNAIAAAPTLLPAAEMFHADHMTEWILIGSSVLAAILGIGVMAFQHRLGIPKSDREITGLKRIMGAQWGFDGAMYKTFVDFGGRFSQGFYRWFDKGVIDGLFVNGSAWTVQSFGRLFRKAQTGYVRSYALTMLLGVVVILGYVIWKTNR